MTEPANILIVDDQEPNRMILNDLIISIGHIPILSIDGNAAIKQIETQAPDVVLLDILMPGKDGYEVLQTIKSNKRTHNIPVIMITAVDNIESVIQCISNGADDYLTKPFNPVLLKARISACLEKKLSHDREQELYRKLEKNFYALQKAEQARDALGRMIIHDLRHPLTSIQGFAQILKSNAENNNLNKEEFLNGLNSICDSSNDMSTLIKGILDVSRLEVGEMPVHKATFNPSQQIGNIFKQFKPIADEIPAKLFFQDNPNVSTVHTDIKLFCRIMQNLIANALTPSVNAKNVNIYIEEENVSTIFCVSNDGNNIPDKFIDRIFEKFFQIEVKSDRKKYGAGLGLAFCKMAVEALNGRIWIENHKGEGCCFKFEIN